MIIQKTSLLDRMTSSEIVLGIIFLKPGDKMFVEEALAYSLEQSSRDYPRLRNLFMMHSDGGPGKTNNFESIITILHMGILAYTSSWQYTYMTEHGRKYTKDELKTGYGTKVFDKLKPLAEIVWQKAKKYKSMYNIPGLYEGLRQ